MTPKQTPQVPKSPSRNNKNLNELPPSSDVEFWGMDSEKVKSEVAEKKPAKKHYLIWDGAHARCVSCEYPHTIPLDFRLHDLVNGKIVRKINPNEGASPKAQ